MVRTILVNLRNYGQWLLAAATFVVRQERTVVALTPPPLVIAQRLFLFTAQRVWHRPSRRIVTVNIAQAVEYYVFRSIFGNEDYNLARLRRWPDIKAAYDGMVAGGRTPLILDCGANIGVSAGYFALEFPAARIVAVEPQPENFRRAVAATAAFPHLKVFEAGVASAPGSAQIVDPSLGTDAYRTELSTGGEIRMVTVPELVREAHTGGAVHHQDRHRGLREQPLRGEHRLDRRLLRADHRAARLDAAWRVQLEKLSARDLAI